MHRAKDYPAPHGAKGIEYGTSLISIKQWINPPTTEIKLRRVSLSHSDAFPEESFGSELDFTEKMTVTDPISFENWKLNHI